MLRTCSIFCASRLGKVGRNRRRVGRKLDTSKITNPSLGAMATATLEAFLLSLASERSHHPEWWDSIASPVITTTSGCLVCVCYRGGTEAQGKRIEDENYSEVTMRLSFRNVRNAVGAVS